MRSRKIKLGKYRHYKGNEYEVLGVARHSETLEELVVYRALYGARDLWVRPLKMFSEKVVVGDKKASVAKPRSEREKASSTTGIPRFRYIGN
ncbi:MAG: DUF1653 domain-containing protein, partial [Parcubacteria group bacterium]|nr:DUF1653 domain-containing protein [Parcubacteria group bacterium]